MGKYTKITKDFGGIIGMKLFRRFIRIFYHKKYKRGYIKTRILFISWRRKSDKKDKINLFIPPIDKVGRCTYSSSDIYIASKDTSIGSFCSIGAGCVLGHGNHPLEFLSSSPYLYFDELQYKSKDMQTHSEYWSLEPIKIGNDVWIGTGAFIKNGIVVGDGSIIGARSVVTKDVPPYAIVAGCPAKIIRYRFDKKIIEKLLKIQWWNLSDEQIKRIPYDNINNAIKFLEEK